MFELNRKFFQLFIRVFIFIAVLPFSYSVQAADCKSGGRINFLMGSSEHFSLQRGSEKLQPKAYMSLCAGDKLILANKEVKASLQLGRNKFEMIKGPLTFEVEGVGQGPGKQYGIMQVAAQTILKQDIRLSRRAQSRSANDITIKFPCLNKGSKCALLAAEERSLSVEWSGGKAPYSAKFNDCGIKSLYKVTTNDNYFQTPKFNLQVRKKYCITLKDSLGVKKRMQFKAVSSVNMPPEPDFTKDPWLSEEQKATLTAMHLIKKGPEWAFEAYQRLVPYVSSHPPAATLAKSLANGEITFN